MKLNTTVHVSPSGEKSVLTTFDWATFRVLDVIPEITRLIALGHSLAETTAAKQDPTFADLVLVWQEFNQRFGRVVGPMHHLNGVMQADYTGLRQAVEEATPLLSAYGSDLALHKGLYDAYVRFKQGDPYKGLRADERYIIDETIKNFELAGVGLPPEKKAALKQVNERQAMLAKTFRDNVQDVQDAWQMHLTDRSELRGIPVDAQRAMKKTAEKKGKEGWCVTLQAPDVLAVLEHADSSVLREAVYRARVTKASELDQFEGKRDNAPIVAEMLSLAREEANLLGFANYAELSLAKKMAKSVGVSGVSRFIAELGTLARPKAKTELRAMRSFAKKELGIAKLAPWDLQYVTEKMRKARYAVDQEALRPYFPFSKVNEAISALLSSLYGVTFVPRPDVKGWNDDVAFFTIVDAAGVLLAGCYVDLFAREGKRGGAWMDNAVDRIKLPDGVQVPVAYLVCNFAKSPDGGETYLSHEEIQSTYFHELGHTLHHMLGKTEYAALSMGGVEWDTVELPSQFMENFPWDRQILKEMSRHKETGAVIPDAEIEKLIGAKFFNTGLFTLRQILFGTFDWELYRDYDPAHPIDANRHWQAVLGRLEVRPRVKWDRFPNGFGHIFAGGYSAGYWSYMWALGLSADAFAVFEEAGNIRSRDIGRRFLKEILEPGCSRPMAESFRAFRGRDLDPKALAVHLGLIPR